MPLDIMYQQKLFEQYQAGRVEALSQLIDEERPYLFDFLLRMTGDMNGAMVTCDQVAGEVLVSSKKWQTLAQVRFDLYARGRERNKALWYADVALLENQALASVMASPDTPLPERKKAAAYSRLDRAISESPAEQREALILHLRCKFTFSDIAKITTRPREQVESMYGSVIQFLQQAVTNLPSDPRSVISRLTPHPMPQSYPTELTDLNELIGGLHKAQNHQGASSFTWLSLFLVLVCSGGLVVLYTRPEGQSLRRLVAKLLSFFN